MQYHMNALIQYGLDQKLITPLDIDYVNNQLAMLLKIEPKTFQTTKITHLDIDAILSPLLDRAYEVGLINLNTITERDLIEARIMDVLMPRPSDYQMTFEHRLAKSPKSATDHFYQQSIKTNYIKTSRIAKNIAFQVPSLYGIFDITINLSKPEKDPRAIARALKENQASNYPKCLLCKENVGYYGTLDHPGRANHRIVKIMLNNEPFYLQYSPYVYYNEHAILLHESHIPMEVNEKTFLRLFDFVDALPHYFMGSNAGLPIVGGSILNHEHYQGGRATFPLHHAKALKSYQYDGVSYEMLKWPISVIRLRSRDRNQIISHAETLRLRWLDYDNKSIGIISKTKDQPHNAITPILRKEDSSYILDIALRNNRTNENFPDGIFHPHPEHHHIKKENIGLIEVMGLAILPGRLQQDLLKIKQILQAEPVPLASVQPYEKWIKHLKNSWNHKDIDRFIELEVAKEFIAGLEDCGVFKQNDEGFKAFDAFLKEICHV